VLIVAPMSGHYATLLRGTVEALLPGHEVYITDWIDARLVPLMAGRFDLDDYIDYVIAMLQMLGPDTHVMAVCQPSVPVLAATARMEAEGDPCAPSLDDADGRADRHPPLADRGQPAGDGTRHRLVPPQLHHPVPFPHPGAFREVYPGFMQLSGFMAMNFDRHLTAHYEMYKHLIEGDGDSAEKHRDFYDEYLAVMDLTAEFYLQTVETVFVEHALPKGDDDASRQAGGFKAIRRVALMTVEGENDDISGVGQTQAAHDLCVNIPDDMRVALPAAGRRPLRRLQRLALPLGDRAAHRRLHAQPRHGGGQGAAATRAPETARKALKIAS
jgi:poly(3-hydroxybutyrate) depolymerase